MKQGTGLLSQQKAANILGVSKSDVSILVATGQLNSVPIGQKVYIPYKSIAALLNIEEVPDFVTSARRYPSSEELSSPLTKTDEVNTNLGDDGGMVYKGSVSKLNDGRFMVQIDVGKTAEGKRKRENTGFRDEAEAREYLRKRLIELNGSNPAPMGTSENGSTNCTTSPYTALTFERYALQYLNNSTAKKRTVENYRVGLNYVLDSLAMMPIAKITQGDLKNAFEPLTSKYADGVIQKAYTIVKLIFKKACAEGDIPKDPTLYWKRPTSNVHKEEKYAIYSEEDFEKMFRVAKEKNYMLYTQFCLLQSCGLRPGEMRALLWEHFDPKNKKIKVEQAIADTFEPIVSIKKKPKRKEIVSVPKSRHSYRTLPLSDKAVEALQTWKKILKKDKNQYKANSIYIFPNKNGSYMSRGGCETAVKRLRKDEELKDIGIYFYKFRHTLCTNLILAGQPIPVIKKIMGDGTDRVIMEIYTHVTEEMAMKAAQGFYDKMNEVNAKAASA